MVLTHTPLLALLEEWGLQVHLPLTIQSLEAVVDDFCFDLPGFSIVEPLHDVWMALFYVIFVSEELPADDLITFLVDHFLASLIHTVLKKL